jgi:CRP/FNR family cyclic AMP-dependent transcriptional regulator
VLRSVPKSKVRATNASDLTASHEATSSISIKARNWAYALNESPESEIMKPNGSDTSTIVEMLQKAPLWSGLTEKELKVIARSFKELKYESGDIIVRKGEAGVGFYLIADGTAEVRSDGKVLSKLGPGQFFGEMSILDGQPRSADVVALEPSRCLALSSWSFKSIVSNHPKMALKLLQESVRRMSMNKQTIGE